MEGDHLAPDLEDGDYVGLVPVEGFCQAGLYLLALTPRPELYICRAAGDGMIEARQGLAARPLALTREQFRIAAVALAWGPLRREIRRAYAPHPAARARPTTRAKRQTWIGSMRHQLTTAWQGRAHAGR